ncbi:MAG: ATP-dependent RecD-like DNA helicase [Acholeplasmatales bacterium]|nr:ATP-dependent RecD-like DNA helicase [Acholeplasmatales bacterium]
MDDLKKTITGEITNYIFESSDSMYKVIKVKLDDDTEITVTGSFPHLNLGLMYEFIGFLKETKYGIQFQVEAYRQSDSFTKEGLISYLSSDRFYGIGTKLAEAIVDNIGTDCINKIIKDPTVLENIKGLTSVKRQVIVESIKNNYLEEQTFIALYSFGLTSKMVEKLYSIYGINAHNKVEENPYRLIDEVEGFGFKKADNLALSLGVKRDSELRVKASIMYTINNICYNYGFTYLKLNQLINSTRNLLCDDLIKEDYINHLIAILIDEKKLVSEDDRIYHCQLYNAEISVKDRLISIYENDNKPYKRADIIKSLTEVESNLDIKYTDHQKNAIINSLENKLSIITGGPGTGKSTIIKGILHTYAKLNKLGIYDDDMEYRVLMVAPTGRAAKRMNEASSFKATTIHKALGYSGEEFQYSEYKKLTHRLVIVDEVSMVDINLMSNLLKALTNSCQLILVGDKDQLPAVGPGNVLKDLMNTYLFKTTRLNQIMRQAFDSNIIKLSSQILSKRIDYRLFSERKEIFFYKCEPQELFNQISKILDNYIEKGGDLLNGIQILIPLYNGIGGINEINREIQNKYNLSEKKLVRDGKVFKQNDKVLQLKNDSELDIMNGDIGKIVDIIKEDDKEVMYVDFYGRMIKYPLGSIDNLMLAYAISIHKSQGSEFENVIMPILNNYNIMLKPNIIYTGVTRAKSKLIILGSPDALNYGIKEKDNERQTSLDFRINMYEGKNNLKRINDKDIPFEYFGEYDMEGITPYSFM